jgi:hypothetical protein
VRPGEVSPFVRCAGMAASVLAGRMQAVAPVWALPGREMKMTWRRAPLGKGRRRRAGGSARRGVMVVVAAGAAVVCAGLLTGAGLAPAAGAPGVQWGRAEEVAGLAALNKGGNANVTSVSCWAPQVPVWHRQQWMLAPSRAPCFEPRMLRPECGR